MVLFYLFPSRRCLEFILLCGVREKRANGLRPTKSMFFMMFRCWLLGRARATQAKESEIQSQLTKTSSKIVGLASLGSLFQPLALEHLKRHHNSLPEPSPGLLGLLSGPRRPKEAPRVPQEPPRPPQELPRSTSRAVLAAIWRPTAAQEIPRSLQDAIVASSGLDFQPSGG